MVESKALILKNRFIILTYWLMFTATLFLSVLDYIKEENRQSKRNIRSFLLKNEQYKEIEVPFDESIKLNSMSIELSEIGATQGETWISGKLSFKIVDPNSSIKGYDIESSELKFTLKQNSTVYNYYPKSIVASCAIEDSKNHKIKCSEDKLWGYRKGHKYIPTKGSHYYYPMDDLSFDFLISISPKMLLISS